ncbi:MAG: DUF58 domain-containing protein [Anaerolineae bacterium]
MPNRRNAVYILLILTLLTGLFTGRAFFFNLAYMLAGLMVISLIWSWLSVRGISIRRKTRSSRAQVGRTLEEEFMVRNTGILPKLWIEVIDESDLPGHRASQIVPALNVRGGHRWQVRTYCTSRGEFRLGPMTFTSGDPFGLFTSQRHLAATSQILVYPQIVQINRFDLPTGLLSGGEAQRRRSHYVTTNAAGVRDYVFGDSFNRIHWPSSARKNRLIVKEFEIDPLVDIWLFADFSRDSLVEDPAIQRVDGTGPIIPTSSGIPPSSEEYVAVVAASLTRYFINLDRTLGFAAYTPAREIHQPERGNRQLTRVLETLAVARSTSHYTLGQMLTLETPYFTRGTTLIIITASNNKEWIREAQLLGQRGIRVMCIFVDPGSFNSQINADNTIGLLRVGKVPTIVVRNGDDLGAVLTERSF